MLHNGCMGLDLNFHASPLCSALMGMHFVFLKDGRSLAGNAATRFLA